MTSFLIHYAIGLGLCSALMGIAFLLYLKTQQVASADLVWGPGIFGVGLISAIRLEANSPLHWIILGVVGLWAFRLSSFLFATRFLRKKPEKRFDKILNSWGPNHHFNVFKNYQLQAFFQSLIAMPLLLLPVISYSPRPFFYILTLSLLAILGETIADTQLFKFSKDPKTKPNSVCEQGLWAYSRHPNCFFDWLFWFSIAMMSFGTGYWGLSMMGPLVLLWMFLKVTIPITEENSLVNRPDYLDYKARVSRFVPFPPRQTPKTPQQEAT